MSKYEADWNTSPLDWMEQIDAMRQRADAATAGWNEDHKRATKAEQKLAEMKQRAEAAERERDAMQRVILRHVAFRAAAADLIRDMRLAINQGTPLIKSRVNAQAEAWLKEFDGPRPVRSALRPAEPKPEAQYAGQTNDESPEAAMLPDTASAPSVTDSGAMRWNVRDIVHGPNRGESLKPGQCACGLYFNQTCSRQPCLRAAPRFPQAVCPHGVVMAELCPECYPKTAEQVERKGE